MRNNKENNDHIENTENKYVINQIVEAIKLFQIIIDHNGTINLTQFSRAMALSKNKTFRILSTLELHGFVEKNSRSQYSIGLSTFDIAHKITSKMFNLEPVRAFLKEVKDIVNESTYFANISPGVISLVDYVDSNRLIKVSSLIGRSIEQSSEQKYSPKASQRNNIDNFIVNVGGFDPEVTAVIAPIDFQIGACRGALVVVAPNSSMSIQRIKQEIIPALQTVIQRHSQSRSIETVICKKIRRREYLKESQCSYRATV